MSSSGSAVDKTYKMLIGGEWVLGDEGVTPIINISLDDHWLRTEASRGAVTHC